MWSKRPTLFADTMTRDAVAKTKRISEDMLTGLNRLMPVDTSQAVSNINLSLDKANYTFIEGKTLGRAGALSQGMSVINSMPKDKLHSVYITNAAPYIGRLEGGSSRQAPSGVFRVVFPAVAMLNR